MGFLVRFLAILLTPCLLVTGFVANAGVHCHDGDDHEGYGHHPHIHLAGKPHSHKVHAHRNRAVQPRQTDPLPRLLSRATVSRQESPSGHDADALYAAWIWVAIPATSVSTALTGQMDPSTACQPLWGIPRGGQFCRVPVHPPPWCQKSGGTPVHIRHSRLIL